MTLKSPVGYSIEITNDRGKTMFLIDKHFGFQYSKSINGIGWFSLPIAFMNPKFLSVDNMVKFYRRPTGRAEELDFIGFLRKWNFSTSAEGVETLHLSGPDQNELLSRRIIAYASGTAEADAGGIAIDDVMKAAIRENLGSLATSGRDITSLSFSIQPDTSEGPTIEKAFAWRKLDRVLEDLNKISRTDGNEVFWFVQVLGVDNDGLPNFELTTRTGQPGNDRTWDSETTRQPMLFGLNYGNLEAPSLQFDYSEEGNYVYAGGQGEGSDRTVVEIQDTGRVNASIWNRRELFIDGRSQETTGQLTALANKGIAENRPRVRFSGKILSTEQTPYGQWGLGDQVTIQYAGYEFNAMIKNILVTVGSDGSESIRSQMEYEATL